MNHYSIDEWNQELVSKKPRTNETHTLDALSHCITLLPVEWCPPFPISASDRLAIFSAASTFAIGSRDLSGATTSTGISDSPTLTSSTSYEPRPGDEKLIRSKVFIDYANSRIVVNKGEPIKVYAILKGYLPSPCHQLRVAQKPVDVKGGIFLEAYSLIAPGTTCIEMLQPFYASIYLGIFSKGQYSVYVNGQILGSFDLGVAVVE
jgi:hypothetical protein